MTLQDILKHVFTDKDLTKEVDTYTVTHTSTDNYAIDIDNGSITLQVVKTKWLC